MSARRTLVVAPHPDDEVLGAGGTMARLAAEGDEVHVVIVTKGFPPHFEETFIEQGRREAAAAHELLGVSRTHFLDLPAAALDTTPHREVNARLGQVLREVRPELVFLPFGGDIHLDHQLVFLSGLVATRPHRDWHPRAVYAYETLSETNWNAPYVSAPFVPTTYFDISAHLDTKLDAMRAFASQIREFPHERSADALRALATLRGSTVGVRAAEAFVLVRQVLESPDR